jgi:hypothetical protein
VLRRRRKIRNGGADAVLQVPALEDFVVDAIVNASDLAFYRGESVLDLLD